MSILRKNIAHLITCVNHYFVFFVSFLALHCNGIDTNDVLPFPYANTARSVRYIGSEQCKTCHEDIYDAYRQSEMGRSMYRVSDAPVIENFSSPIVNDHLLRLSYKAYSINGTVFQQEFRGGANGEIIHRREVEAEYVMGSGNNLRMYFYEDGGMLYEHPLTWYVHEKKFDLSPGYKDFGNMRFSRFTSAKCLSCHNSYLIPDTLAVDRYQTPFDLGIGCERCHGPGELHQKEARGEEIRGLQKNAKTIINPKSLPHTEQLDVCRQCHLQGKAWVLTKQDENYFDYRPGELLSSHRSVYFKTQTKKEVVEVGDSPQRLAMSRCFQESGEALTCITCHNPHYSIKSFTSDYYNAKCRECHSTTSLEEKKLTTRHLEASDCISCHMNRTGNNNTLHGVSNTDHWIRKDAGSTAIDWKSLKKPTHQPLTQLSAFLDNHDSLSGERLAEAYLYYFKEHDPRPAYLDSAAAYLQPYIEKSQGTVRSYSVMGQIYTLTGRLVDAAEMTEKAITLNPFNSELHFQLGNILTSRLDHSGARSAYSRASALKPNEPKYLEAVGMAHYRLKKFDEAMEFFEKAIRLDSQNGEAFFYLGNIYAVSKNNPASALPLYRKSVLLLPDLENAHLNLGNAYLLLQMPDSAIFHYQMELRNNPRSVPALINTGKAYAALGDPVKEHHFYRRALAIDPTAAAAKELRQ